MALSSFARASVTGSETATATREAAESAAADLGSDAGAELAVVMSGPSHDVETIRDTIGDHFGDINLIGATTAGEFTDAGSSENGIVLALLSGEQFDADTALAEGVSEDVFGTVQQGADALATPDDLDGDHAAAITFHNGLAGKGEQITLVTSQLLPDIPLAGGSAGDNLALEETTVFTDEGVSSDGVALAAIGSDQPFGLAANHGHEPLSDTYEVTETDENVVEKLDGEPAFQVWADEIRDHARANYDIDVETLSADDDAFAELLNQYELGIETGEDEYKIRWPALTDSTDGPLIFATGVPEGSTVKIMHSPKNEQVDSARAAATQSLDAFDGDTVGGALVFDCVCRGLILGDEFQTAVDEIADELQAPLAGFETYGEVCMPPEAASGYHNTTTAILLLPG